MWRFCAFFWPVSLCSFGIVVRFLPQTWCEAFDKSLFTFWLKYVYIFFNVIFCSCLSCLATYGCRWPAWWSSCSYATSFTRSRGESAAIRTTCGSSIIWRPGLTALFHCLIFGETWHFVQYYYNHRLAYFLICSFWNLRFAVATSEELVANNDDCAICWDSMSTARKLPCGHLFHK